MSTYTVYKYENKVNHKIYIGCTCQTVEARLSNGRGYDGLLFGEAIKKYGIDGFIREILASGLDRETAFETERYYISYYHSNERAYGYNIAAGGAGTLGVYHSEETRKKMSNSLKGRTAWNKGIQMSEDFCVKHSGENNSMYGKNPWNKGKTMPDELRKNLSESWDYDKHFTPETKLKMKESRNRQPKGFNSPHEVEMLTLSGEHIQTFKSLAEAGRFLNVPYQLISECCKGLRLNYAGYMWRYSSKEVAHG